MKLNLTAHLWKKLSGSFFKLKQSEIDMHVSINSCEAERKNLIIKNKIQLEERLNYLFRCSIEHGSTKLLSYEEIKEYAAKNREKIDQLIKHVVLLIWWYLWY